MLFNANYLLVCFDKFPSWEIMHLSTYRSFQSFAFGENPREAALKCYIASCVIANCIEAAAVLCIGFTHVLEQTFRTLLACLSYSMDLIFRFKTDYEQMTCVACHPKDPCIATGCKDGKILIW